LLMGGDIDRDRPSSPCVAASHGGGTAPTAAVPVRVAGKDDSHCAQLRPSNSMATTPLHDEQ
ncbi:hypothetical protein Dimus_027057, partial [Dionaea muscipula]